MPVLYVLGGILAVVIAFLLVVVFSFIFVDMKKDYEIS